MKCPFCSSNVLPAEVDLYVMQMLNDKVYDENLVQYECIERSHTFYALSPNEAHRLAAIKQEEKKY